MFHWKNVKIVIQGNIKIKQVEVFVCSVHKENIMMTQVQALRAKIALLGRFHNMIFMVMVLLVVKCVMKGNTATRRVKFGVHNVQEESTMMKRVPIQALRVKIALLERMDHILVLLMGMVTV